MIILLPLLRKLSVRSRALVGALAVIAGVAMLVAGLAVDGGVSVIVGLVFAVSAWSSARRARRLAGRSATG